MALAEIALKPPVRSRRLHAVRPAGYAAPRLAPPLPATTQIAELKKAAKLAGLRLMEWQEIACRYVTATYRNRWLYPEVALIVARQNGKTSILIPRIVMGLLRGERIMHTAQDRVLPREVYSIVAAIVESKLRPLLKSKPRFANGTEQIRMVNGGEYRIVSPSRAGARGPANDLVIIDETREMSDFDFIAAAEPTLTVSRTPQIIYLSNAGSGESVVLNSLRKRAESDRHLAYLEWSAAPERLDDDREGWREANPRLGSAQDHGMWDYLERKYESYSQADTLNIWENEHLCRWSASVMERAIAAVPWDTARAELGEPIRPQLAVKVDPEGRRVSAAIAWMTDTTVNVHLLAEFKGDPVDLDAIARDLAPLMRRFGIREPGFDPWTDRDLARHFKMPRAINGSEYEAASERFKRAVESGQLRHDDNAELTADLNYTVKRPTTHGWMAVRATADRPTTASEAAIRAVWLATKPAPRAPRCR